VVGRRKEERTFVESELICMVDKVDKGKAATEEWMRQQEVHPALSPPAPAAHQTTALSPDRSRQQRGINKKERRWQKGAAG
jgi:hypothetical protein